MNLKVVVLPGDGVGPEVTSEAVKVLKRLCSSYGHELTLQCKDVGGAALTASNDPLPKDTIQACVASNAVLLGAVGGPAFDTYPSHLRPERGLLRLRQELGVFANLRPAVCLPAVEDS